MKRRVTAALRALRDFLRGFTGLHALPGRGAESGEGETKRPFCC